MINRVSPNACDYFSAAPARNTSRKRGYDYIKTHYLGDQIMAKYSPLYFPDKQIDQQSGFSAIWVRTGDDGDTGENLAASGQTIDLASPFISLTLIFAMLES